VEEKGEKKTDAHILIIPGRGRKIISQPHRIFLDSVDSRNRSFAANRRARQALKNDRLPSQAMVSRTLDIGLRVKYA
jgi:hypothetical protein